MVAFDPSMGDEIRKQRPAVVMSSDSMGRLGVKLVAPITGWQVAFASAVWMVRIDPDPRTGLTKVSAADTLQMRSVAVHPRRFIQRLGVVAPDVLQQIAAAVALVVGYAVH